MKLHSLICLALFSFPLRSQIVFCPAGAQWHYSYVPHNLYPPPVPRQNVSIIYVRDSFVGIDTVKVLLHDRYFPLYNSITHQTLLTLIKQTGDLVYFRNKATKHTWQIFFNFALPPGYCWQTNLWDIFDRSRTFTYCVDSVRPVLHNGMVLKTLYTNGEPGMVITERFGPNDYLFYFPYQESSDGDYLDEVLCYRDNEFGIIQFGSKPCDFSNPVGIFEQSGVEELRLFPNPASEQMLVLFSGSVSQSLISYSITNQLSQCLMEGKVVTNPLIVSTSELSPGLYYIHFKTVVGTLTKSFLKIN